MMRAAARCVEQGGTRTGDTSVGARLIHVGLRRCTVAPGGQKVDFGLSAFQGWIGNVKQFWPHRDALFWPHLAGSGFAAAVGAC